VKTTEFNTEINILQVFSSYNAVQNTSPVYLFSKLYYFSAVLW